jgi:transposase
MDLLEFYGAYRADGVGRRAYDPSAMVALLLYGYSRGVRSARAIERACVEDVAFRMIAMLETPDHATIARFVARHEIALADLFSQVLGLCAQAGLVPPGGGRDRRDEDGGERQPGVHPRLLGDRRGDHR